MLLKNKLPIVLILFSMLMILNISQCFNVSGLAVQNCDVCNECLGANSYIIRFKDEPLSVFKYKLENKIRNIFLTLEEDSKNNIIAQKFVEYKNKLLSIHKTAKEDILKLIGSKFESKVIFANEFTNIFNGIVIKQVDQSVLEKIKELPYVESVSQSRKLRANLEESVPLIGADEVWQLHDMQGQDITGKGVTVAVIDTGIDYNHPDLKDKIWVNPGEDLNGNGIVDKSDFNDIDDDGNGLVDDIRGWDFNTCALYDQIGDYEYECIETKPEDNDVMDYSGHGTHVAGIVAGVAPDVKIIPFKVLNDQGIGDESWTMIALDRAMDPNNDGDFSDHADIVSFSLGSLRPGDPDDNFCKAVDNAVESGIIVVAAAGNLAQNPDFAGNHTITSPGCANRSICVGSSSKSDKVASSSSRGPVEWNGGYLIKPDVVAPGVSIRSTAIGSGYTYKSGTSMATPHVTGAAALLLQAHPNWSPDDVKNALKDTAIDIGEDENAQGSGRIDVLAAINLSNAPPIAVVDIQNRIDHELVYINGTAMNGTGNYEGFNNYSLYYKSKSEWVKICENNEEVNDGLLCTWDTTLLAKGIYKLKLDVRSIDQASIDIVSVALGFDDNDFIIDAPDDVNELDHFTVNITNVDFEPVKAWVLFIAPHHIPRIKYGDSVTFKAPRIINPFAQNLESKIIAIRLIGFQKNNKVISVINN